MLQREDASIAVFPLEIALGVYHSKKNPIDIFKRCYGRKLQRLNLNTYPNDSDITAVTKVWCAAPHGHVSRNLL